MPHQFVPNQCKALFGKIKPNAIAISLIKGFDKAEGGGIDLISHIITRHLNVSCSVLMGANLANEVADGQFCETTIGCRDPKYAKVLRNLFQAEHFRVVVVDDADAVEICGALKVLTHFSFLFCFCVRFKWDSLQSKHICFIFRLEYRCNGCRFCRWSRIRR